MRDGRIAGRFERERGDRGNAAERPAVGGAGRAGLRGDERSDDVTSADGSMADGDETRRTWRDVRRHAHAQLRAGKALRASGLVWVLVAMCIAAALISDAFLNPFNLINVARQVALFGIVSVGMTFVILTAGIDLSVGSIVAVAAVVSALLLDAGVAVPLVILAGLAIGVALGAVNGAGITLGRLPPFIMTLGMMVMGRGLAMTISDGHPIHFQDASADFAWLGQGYLLGLPVPVWIFAAVAAIAYVVLRYTPFGRNIYAVGSQPGSGAARRHQCQAGGLFGLCRSAACCRR